MAMTVKELRESLVGLPDDMPVILQKDAEGNGYSPLSGADGDNAGYVPEETWYGVYRLRLDGYGEDDVRADAEPSLVLWPVN